jgi:hypothetical protein
MVVTSFGWSARIDGNETTWWRRRICESGPIAYNICVVTVFM